MKNRIGSNRLIREDSAAEFADFLNPGFQHRYLLPAQSPQHLIWLKIIRQFLSIDYKGNVILIMKILNYCRWQLSAINFLRTSTTNERNPALGSWKFDYVFTWQHVPGIFIKTILWCDSCYTQHLDSLDFQYKKKMIITNSGMHVALTSKCTLSFSNSGNSLKIGWARVNLYWIINCNIQHH